MVKDSLLLWVSVSFSQADIVVHHNDFLMQIPMDVTRYIGREGPLGEQLDKGIEFFETSETNVPAFICQNIERYGARFQASTKPIFDARGTTKRDLVDRLGFLSRPEVIALIGSEKDVSVLSP